jgi:hypothetical protein
LNRKSIAGFLLAFALTLAGYAGGENSYGREGTSGKQMPTDGKAEGILTINSKAYPLKYVYTGMEKGNAGEKEMLVEVLITNEPLAKEAVNRIALELGVGFLHRREESVIKSASVKGAYFVFNNKPRYGDKKIAYRGYIITSDGFFDANGAADIMFNGNRVSSKIENEIEDYKINKKHERVNVNAKISVSFDVNIKDGTLITRSISDTPPPARLPDEGKASGTLMLSGRKIDLTSAYALREKNEAGPKERITVLITDDRLPKETLLYSFERAIPRGYYGLYLYLDSSGNFETFTIKHPNGYLSETAASLSGLKLENGKIAGTAQYKSQDGDKSYSVTFEAPLKD